MLSLTVDEIDCEKMVLSGKIVKMYLARLDMYLKEIIGEGFTYNKKWILLENMY